VIVMNTRHGSLWGVILAGGEGTRLQGFVREQLGTAIPKQFCAFVGRRSMLERTVRRARLLIPSERLVVIGTAHHNSYMYRHIGAPLPGTVLFQPINRDTAPGIVLPLIHILRRDPQAVVAIQPSDHFILPGRRFMRAIEAAAEFVVDHSIDRPILLAVKPGWADPEYGWIEPGKFVEEDRRKTIRQIDCFIEKPPPDQAEQLMNEGWLWNTMVIVARARVLMDLVWKHVPDMAYRFALLQRFLGGPREQEFIKETYQAIPDINFSTSVLANKDVRSLVLPVQDIYWSDWGTKERIFHTAAAFGLSPSVSVPMRQTPDAIPT